MCLIVNYFSLDNKTPLRPVKRVSNFDKQTEKAMRKEVPSSDDDSESDTVPIPDSFCLPNKLGHKTVVAKLKNSSSVFLLKEVSEVLRNIARAIRIITCKPDRDSLKRVIRRLVTSYPHFNVGKVTSKSEQIVRSFLYLYRHLFFHVSQK